jgi:hypothetical protein
VQATLRYRGREITEGDIVFLRRLIAESPQSSRRKLSVQVCEAWNWRQANGGLRDMVCRSMMLMLHRAGRIELPPIRRPMVNYVIARRRPRQLPADFDRSPIEVSLAELAPIEWRQAERVNDFETTRDVNLCTGGAVAARRMTPVWG